MGQDNQPTMYWQVDYRGNHGWRTRYYFGEEDVLRNRLRKLQYDKIEIKNLTLAEVKAIQVIKGDPDGKLFKVL